MTTADIALTVPGAIALFTAAVLLGVVLGIWTMALLVTASRSPTTPNRKDP